MSKEHQFYCKLCVYCDTIPRGCKTDCDGISIAQGLLPQGGNKWNDQEHQLSKQHDLQEDGSSFFGVDDDALPLMDTCQLNTTQPCFNPNESNDRAHTMQQRGKTLLEKFEDGTH